MKLSQTFLWEEQLVHHDVVGIDLVCCEFLDKPFGLIERPELGDANANESSFFL